MVPHIKVSAYCKKEEEGTSLVVQWLRLCAPNAGGPGSIPGLGTRSLMHAATKSPHAATKTQLSLNKEIIILKKEVGGRNAEDV